MNKCATTKDELFLVKLHELALLRGEDRASINRYLIGRAIGQNDKGVDNIIKHLAQANFIKKGNDASIYLTPQGLELIKNHLIST